MVNICLPAVSIRHVFKSKNSRARRPAVTHRKHLVYETTADVFTVLDEKQYMMNLNACANNREDINQVEFPDLFLKVTLPRQGNIHRDIYQETKC